MSALFCSLLPCPLPGKPPTAGLRPTKPISARVRSAVSLPSASIPGGRAEDDDDWDECEFEPGVHEVWDPGSLGDDDDDSLPEAGDFWIDQDDEEAQVCVRRRRTHKCG